MHTEEVINKVESPKRHLNIVLLIMLIFFVISLVTNILNSILVDVKDSFDLSLARLLISGQCSHLVAFWVLPY